MKVLPLWVSIFVAGVAVGLFFNRAGQAENGPPTLLVEESATNVIESTSRRKQPFQPLAGVNSDALEVANVLRRLIELEERVAVLEREAVRNPGNPQSDVEEPAVSDETPETPEQYSRALANAGFEQAEVNQILRLHDQHQLDRLELRDRATREGWRDTLEYRAALRDLGDRTAQVRLELADDDEFDRYLYALGLSNRVNLQSTIPKGEAELAGLQSGDVILSYAGRRVFRIRELQQATSAGERGELVAIEVEREGDTFELYVPRGPLGVTITGGVQSPQ